MNNIINKDRTRKKADPLYALWITASVFCIFLPPIGLFFTIILYIFEYLHPLKAERYILFCSIFIFLVSSGMCFFLLFAFLLLDSKLWLMIIFYAASAVIGILMMIIYRGLNNKKNIFDLCIRLVKDEHIVSLEKISKITSKDIGSLKKIYSSIIKNGYLNDCSIDEKGNELVFGHSIWAKQHVVCENCAAELVVDFGTTLICEFCGSALKVRNIRNN